MVLNILTFFLALLNIVKTQELISSCVHEGKNYNSGDIFTSTDPLLQSEAMDDECVQCRCHLGLVLCGSQKCPKIDCLKQKNIKPVQSRPMCCKQCQETLTLDSLSISISSTNTSKFRKKGTSCLSNGSKYEEGAVWQPVIGPFGIMSCVECTCRNGQISCNRFKCSQPPCTKPVFQFGQCCPVCPVKEHSKMDFSHCLPKASEVLIYKISTSETVEFNIKYAFIKMSNNMKVESHEWHIKETSPKIKQNKFDVILVNWEDFKFQRFPILGSTSSRNLERFTRREKKLAAKCVIKCSEKLLKLEETLKIFKPISRTHCNYDEIDVRFV